MQTQNFPWFKKRRPLVKKDFIVFSALIAVFVTSIYIAVIMFGAGYAPQSWPGNNEWTLLTRGGKVITDREARSSCSDTTYGAANPSQENDIGSQAKCSGTKYNPGKIDEQFGTGQQPNSTDQNTYSGGIYFLDGSNNSSLCTNLSDDYLFFRIRLAANPLETNTANGLKNNVWFATFDVDNNGIIDFYVRLNGAGNTSTERLEILHEESTGPSDPINNDPTGEPVIASYQNPLGINPAGPGWVKVTATPDNSTVGDTTEYFLDFQVPFENFKSSGGSQLLCEGNAIVLVNYSTSDNANDVFKKDKMADGSADPIFFSKPKYVIEKTATDLNGGSLLVDEQVEYSVVVKNLASTQSKLVVTDVLPSGATYVNGSIKVVINGNTYNMTDAADSPDAGSPQCFTSTHCEADYNITTANAITFKNDFLYAKTSAPPLYDTITIKYRVYYDEDGTYSNQAKGKTYELPLTRLSDDPTYNDNSDCNTANTYNCNDGIKDNDDSTKVTVTETPKADIAITKSNGVDEVTAGSTVTYTITVTNNGPSDVSGIMVDDAFPPELIDITWTCTASAGSTCPASGNGNINHTIDLLNGGSATYTIQTTVSPDAAGTLVNSASAVVPEGVIELNSGNNTSTDTDTILRSTDLSITKTSDPNPVIAGNALTYTLTVTNSGPSTATNVSVSDLLPVNFNLESATSSQGSCIGNVLCDLGTVESGDTVTITITGTVLSSVPDQTALSNTANVSGYESDPNTANNSVTQETTVHTSADIAITKMAAPEPVTAGSNIIYTVQVTNNGPSDAVDVQVTDTLPNGVTFVEATSNQGSCSESNGTVSCMIGTVPYGANVNISIVVQVPSSATEEETYTNTATATSSTSDPDPSNNNGSTSTTVSTVTTIADLSITKTSSPNPVVAGNELTYTLTVTNNGPSDAGNVSVVDNLPFGFVFENVSIDNGSCEENTGTVTCIIDTLTSGSNVVITITGKPMTDGNITNTAQVTSATFDPDQNNNTASTQTTVTPSSNLEITKTASPNPVNVGLPLTYTISVSNSGPNTAMNVVLTDILPTNVTYSSVQTNQGTCQEVNKTVTCQLGNIAVDNTVTIEIEVIPTVAGVLSNSAQVTSDTSDPDDDNNTSTVETTVDPTSDVSIVKTASPEQPVAGENVTYTLHIQNNGPSDASNVVVSDTLPGELTFVSASTPQGTCEENAGVVECNVGTVAANQGFDITIVASVPASLEKQSIVTNRADVSSDTYDNEMDNNSSTVVSTVDTKADITVIKSDDPDPVVAGNQLVYTVIVENKGPSDAQNVSISDALPAQTVFIDATPSQGMCINDDGVIKCELGTLGNNSTAIVAISVQILSSVRDGTVISNTAVASSTTTDPDPSNNDGTTSTEVTTVTTEADLSIRKSVSPEAVVAGSQVVYTLVVGNNGPSDASNINVTDILPTQFEFVSVVTDHGSCNENMGSIECNISSLSSGETATITITMNVLGDGQVINTAYVSGEVLDNNLSNNQAEVISDVEPRADLVIEKRALPLVVFTGDNIVYTLNISNNGPSTAQNVTINDTLPEGVTFVSVDSVEADNCDFEQPTVVCEFAVLEPGQTAIITIIVTTTRAGSIDNIARVSSSTEDLNSRDNETTLTTIIGENTDLSIQKIGVPPQPNSGSIVNYTVTISNLGQYPAQNVTVTDITDSTVTVLNISSTSGTCTLQDNVITCEVGNIPAGGSVVITYQTDVPLAIVSVRNTASFRSETPDPNQENNSIAITVNLPIDRTIAPPTPPSPTPTPNPISRPGGGGGGSGGGSAPQLNIIAALPQYTHCLDLNPTRNLTFNDLGTAEESWRRPINIFKYTFQTKTRNYLLDGYRFTSTGNTNSVMVKPNNDVTRVELLKILMNSHCLEIKNRENELKRENGDAWKVFKDLPLKRSQDIGTQETQEIIYSAFYYGIIDGTTFGNAEPYRPPTIAESVKIFMRIREKITGQKFTQDSPGTKWWAEFYQKALTNGISNKLLDGIRVFQNLKRGEGVFELMNSMLKTTELYKPEVKTKVEKYLQTGSFE